MRPPLQHQAHALDRSLNERSFALFFEQRCGKTKVIIDTAAHHYRWGSINTLIVVAWPNGVQNVWSEEWPKDWPDNLPSKMVVWKSGKMASKDAMEELRALISFDGMAVIAMNCEALSTDLCGRFLKSFLAKRKALLVADESSWAKSPTSRRSKALITLGRHENVVFKRILDGTPADEGPLDLFMPCFFLDPKLLGYGTIFAYKSRYCKLEAGYGPGGRQFTKIAGYRNLEELNAKLEKFSVRVRRADISDAPPKVYQSRFFQLTAKQRKVYDRLRDDYVAQLGGGDQPVGEVLRRMTRLQMIARNYYPPEETSDYCPACHAINADDCEVCEGFGVVVQISKMQRIDDTNPAQLALIQELKVSRGPSIVWCRFRQDVSDAMEASALAGRVPVRFDGTVPASIREEGYLMFRGGAYDDIVATISSGLSRGRDLTRGVSSIYYSNEFALRARRQSEDRTESLSRAISTDVIDLVAEDTRDLDAIQALRNKRDIASMIVGDPVEKWI